MTSELDGDEFGVGLCPFEHCRLNKRIRLRARLFVWCGQPGCAGPRSL